MGAMSVGIPELMIVLVVAFIWGIPVIAAIWALVTLYRMKTDQQKMRRSLENIEHLLQQR